MTQDNTTNKSEITDEQMAAGLNIDDSIAGLQTLDEGDIPEEQSDAEAAALRDKYVRLMAEFDNYRKRMAREAMDLRQTGGREVVAALLDVLDDTDRAAQTIDKENNPEQIREGVNLVFQKLRSVLQQQGLQKMDAQGQPFDPELHDAITEIPAPSPDQVGTVMDVVQPGYYLKDKILRHAKVVVGK